MVSVLRGSLHTDLLSVVAYGSWIHGDFEPSRSDVDLLGVVGSDPTPDRVDALAHALDRALEKRPQWVDRIEIGLVSPGAVSDVIADGQSRRLTARLSPGEPLHLVPADRRRLLDWDAAERGETLYRPAGMLPAVPRALVRQVLLEELKLWPGWVDDLAGVEPLAYAVLTVCRGVAYATTGEPHSKRAGGRWVAQREPELRSVIDRAERVWYEPGTDVPLFHAEVQRFVAQLVPRAIDDLNRSPG